MNQESNENENIVNLINKTANENPKLKNLNTSFSSSITNNILKNTSRIELKEAGINLKTNLSNEITSEIQNRLSNDFSYLPTTSNSSLYHSKNLVKKLKNNNIQDDLLNEGYEDNDLSSKMYYYRHLPEELDLKIGNKCNDNNNISYNSIVINSNNDKAESEAVSSSNSIKKNINKIISSSELNNTITSNINNNNNYGDSSPSDDEDSIDSSLLSYDESDKHYKNSNKRFKNNVSHESYEKFDLEKRNTPNYFNRNERVTHKYLPLHLKNNSKYKKKLMAYFRKDISMKSKNESCSHFNFLKNSRKSNGNLRNLKNSNFNYKRYTSCTNKINEVERGLNHFSVEDYDSQVMIKFNLYQDEDIGFDLQWQSQMKITEMDDDVMTDDDQLDAAARHIKKEVRESCYIVDDSLKKIRNLVRFKHLNPKIVFKENSIEG